MIKRTTSEIVRFECNTDVLNVRSKPSTYGPILCKLKKGDRVELLYKVKKNWARIKCNGIYGYVSLQYLSKVNLDYISYNIMKCNIDILPLRMGPANSERVIGQLKNNDKVEVVYHVSTGWTKIKHYNKYAYVSTSYLTAI